MATVRNPTPLATARVTIRQGDDLPGFAGQIIDERGEVIDLTGARVVLHIANDRAELVDGEWVEQMLVDDDCWIENPAAGVFTYDWSAGQTAEWRPGIYDLHVEAIYDDGRIFGAPSDRSVDFIVRPRVFTEDTVWVPPLAGELKALRRGVFQHAGPQLRRRPQLPNALVSVLAVEQA